MRDSAVEGPLCKCTKSQVQTPVPKRKLYVLEKKKVNKSMTWISQVRKSIVNETQSKERKGK
jgi:hypothetical protein